MSDMEQWQLIPESGCDDQDDYADDEQIRRDIAGWEQEYAAWERNEMPLRATMFTESGQRLELEMMTRVQHDTRLAELKAGNSAGDASEAVTLLAQLLTWTGRAAMTPDETEQVQNLRRRAETLLQQAGVLELA